MGFNFHIEDICKKSGQNFMPLQEFAKFTDQDNIQTLMNAFISYQLRWCPVVLMFHNRNVNNKIKKIHERALRIKKLNEAYLSGEV